MLTCLILCALWLPLDGCGTPPRTGVYLSLKFTYYDPTLETLKSAFARHMPDVVYPELGVFDPDAAGFTDFAGSFRVGLGDRPPENSRITAPRAGGHFPRAVGKRERAWDGPLEASSPGDRPLLVSLATLPARLREAFSPSTRRVAWIYLDRRPRPEDGPDAAMPAPRPSSPTFDLRNPSHRASLIATLRVLQRYGFDGVQLDLEPFPASDVPAMIDTLREARAATGSSFMLSLFAPKYVRAGARYLNPGFVWTSPDPFIRLLAHCDQLMVPLYDYGPLAANPAAYRQRIGEVVTDLYPKLKPRDRVWFALPAYRNTEQHGSSETLENAATALRKAGKTPGGLAVFGFTGEAGDFQP